MQMRRNRAPRSYRSICRDTLRSNLMHTHAHTRARAPCLGARMAADTSSSSPPRDRRIYANSKSIDHTPGTILA